MGFSNPSRYNNRSRAFKAKKRQSKNQKRVNWAKKSSMRRKGASAQAKQINAIAKTVDNLDEQLNPRTGKYTLAQGLYYNSGAIRVGYNSILGQSPTQVFPLMPAQVAGGLTEYAAWDRWGPGVSSGTDDSSPTAFGISEISTC